MALTNIDGKGGINILTETGDFKSTYEILLGISKVWKEMDDVSQAALLELVAGKTRGSVVAALFQNGDVLEQAYNSAAGASGSAMNELNTYLNSIQGRIDIFNNSLQTMWMNFIDSDALKIIVDMGTAAIRLVDSIGLLPTVIGGFSAFKLITKDVKAGLDAVNKSVEQSIASKQAEAAASEANAAAQAMENTQENAGVVAKEAGATAGWKDVVATNAQTAATKALAIAKGLLTGIVKGVAIMLASQVIGKAFEWIYKKIDDTIHHAEYLKEEVTELQQTYENAKKTFNENLTELTTSSDTKIYATLEDEFKRLTKGVDKYGNNISLTSDQYERYKEICEQIVGINPAIAAGYDSATKAIGNNASALSQLIELQKTQQRQNVKDLIKPENLDKIAENALNDYKAATLEEGQETYSAYGSVRQALQSSLSAEINDLLASDLNYNSSINDDYMRLILERLGHDETTGIVQSYWNQALGDYDFSRFINDYLNEIANNVDKFGDDYQEIINDAISQYNQALKYNKDVTLEARNGLIDTLLQVPYGEVKYDALSDPSKNIITEWIKNSEIFKIDPEATEEEIKEQLDENVKAVQKFVNQFADENIQAIVDSVDDLDKSALTAREYLDEIRNASSVIWDAIGGENNQYGFTSTSDIEKMFGIDINTELNKWDQATKTIANYLGKKRSDITKYFDYKTMTKEEMDAFLGIDWNAIGRENVKDISDVFNLINDAIIGSDITSFKTYSVLSENVTNYSDVLSQTKEIVADNAEITEEYKEALVALGISEDELNECFDENNELVVKDAKALNNLVKSAKKNTAQNIKLAKSQARLEYYELYKEMKQLTNGTQVTDEATLNYINSLYRQMNVLQRTIAKYSLLEAELLGTANAYQELADAQAADEAMDYGSKAEELVNVLAEAFNTAQLGTESARVAIEGLIPDGVIDKSKTLNEQMQQVYDYFTNGPVSQLFTIEFDEEGAIQSVEMTKENIQAFTESLIGTDEASVFQGSWDEFTLNPAIKNLEDFANAIGTTKEVVFAYLTELEKYDIGNVLGGGDSLLDQLMGDNLDYQLQKAIEAAAEVEKKLAERKLSANDQEYQDAQKQLEEREEQAITDTTAWAKKQNVLQKQEDKLKELQEQYEKVHEADGDTSAIEAEMKTTGEAIDGLLEDLRELDEPTEFVLEVAKSEAEENLADFKEDLAELVDSGDEQAIKVSAFVEKIDTTGLDDLESLGFTKGEDGIWRGSANIEGWSSLDPSSKQMVLDYINQIEDDHLIELLLGQDTPTVEEHLKTISETLERIANLLDPTYILSVITSGAQEKIDTFKSTWDTLTSKEITLTQKIKTITEQIFGGGSKDVDAVSVNGTANAHGSWGAPKTETSLVGELGPEILVRGNRWTTVGDNGAEFTQVKKGDIIFNHKQTKQLLKNGYVTGRGKAYAGGTAYAKITTPSFNRVALGGVIDTWDNAYQIVYNDYSNSVAAEKGSTINTYDNQYENTDSGSSGDAADEFEETFDWIEVRMEEFEEKLSKLNAELENQTTYIAKNAKIDEIIAVNRKKLADSKTGADYYEDYAQKYYSQIPSQYQEMAKNGEIAITDFAGEASEATVEAIQKYREYIQKAADLNQQVEEIITEIRDLAIQKIDNIQKYGSAKTGIEDSQIEKIQNAIDLIEESGNIASAVYYTDENAGMMENARKKIEYWQPLLKDIQTELDEAVKNGTITVGSIEWYEQLEKLYEVQAAIDEATIELEEFQNAVNQIYWDNFDELINRLDYLKEETESLIDLMDSADMVSAPKDKDFWGADDVEWTKEGITTLGLYAQEMQRAEYAAQKYADAIDDLTTEYKASHYSESEYQEKLAELKKAQYDELEAIQDAKDGIVELNEARVDAIKDGIQKEIEAYEELIDKKKEELDAEKDLYDFQKSVAEQQKDIADIQRKLAALSGDNSSSAVAQRKKLEAELAEAKAALEESYYERSIDNRQNALDKELEDFQTEKETEIEMWEQYLENVEQVVADSLANVTANYGIVYDTLDAKADEYDLTLSGAIISPWQDGITAIGEYTTAFGDSTGSTLEQLKEIEEAWQAIIDKQVAADNKAMGDIDAANDRYAAATKKPEPTPSKPTTDSKPSTQEKAITVGGKINASGAKIYSYAGDKNGLSQYFASDPIYTVLQEKDGYLLVRHHKSSSGVTGWFKKSDVKAYAKGTTGVNKDQWAVLDELGDELIMHADGSGRLAFLSKGSAVIPHDISENLMQLGSLDPSEVLSRSAPQIGVHPEIHNTEINLNITYGDMVSIGEFHGDNLADLEKIVAKQFEQHTKNINQALRKYTR